MFSVFQTLRICERRYASMRESFRARVLPLVGVAVLVHRCGSPYSYLQQQYISQYVSVIVFRTYSVTRLFEECCRDYTFIVALSVPVRIGVQDMARHSQTKPCGHVWTVDHRFICIVPLCGTLVLYMLEL